VTLDPHAAVDPYAPEVVADPFPAYARLRAEARPQLVPGRDVWTLSRYEDVATAAGDATRFSSRETNGYERRPLNVLVGTDPPEHTRLRRLASRAFSTGRLASLWPRVDRIVAERVGGFVEGGGGDVVGDLAEPLACAAFADLLGLEPAGLAARRAGLGLRPDPRAAWRAFFLAAIEERRSRPGDDLISTLLEPEPGGDRLSADELAALLGLLLAAGVDTTRDLVANLFAELALHGEQWERLVSEPALVGSAVEEALRYVSAIQAMFRTATCDVEMGGTTIPAGARVMLLFGSADRDERRWPDGARFDVTRYAGGLAQGGAHVAFGAGPHACPGAQLARRLARGALSEMVRRGARLEVAGPVQRGRNPCFRSLISFPLRVRQE
jgi:beta-dihydromenaquinone-9 omega-hydroxylase